MSILPKIIGSASVTVYNILLCEYMSIMINNESSTRYITREQHSFEDNSRFGKCSHLSYTVSCEVAVAEKANCVGCHTETTVIIALNIT